MIGNIGICIEADLWQKDRIGLNHVFIVYLYEPVDANFYQKHQTFSSNMPSVVMLTKMNFLKKSCFFYFFFSISSNCAVVRVRYPAVTKKLLPCLNNGAHLKRVSIIKTNPNKKRQYCVLVVYILQKKYMYYVFQFSTS